MDQIDLDLKADPIVSPAPAAEMVAQIRAAIRAEIATERSEVAQIALSRLAALVDQLSPADMTAVEAQIGAIMPALTPGKPNIAFVERVVVNIGNTLLKKRRGIAGAICRATNGSPLVAVYFALMLSLLSYLILIGLYDVLQSFHMLPTFVIFAGPQFVTTVSFGFLGAMVSIAFRLDTAEVERVGLVPLFLVNLVKPYIGAMFGLIVYCILQTKIIMIAGINDSPVQTLGRLASASANDRIWTATGEIFTVHDYLATFMSALVGFLSGFSERFAADLIDKSSRAFIGTSGPRAKAGTSPRAP
jgi:hypothetical protein